jgi:uncharacterized protein with beta-barrel porin domain
MRLRSSLFLAVALAVLGATSHAQTSWVNPGSGSWFDAANWDNGTPDATVLVLLPLSEIPAALDELAPEEYAALGLSAVAISRAHNSNILNHLEEARYHIATGPAAVSATYAEPGIAGAYDKDVKQPVAPPTPDIPNVFPLFAYGDFGFGSVDDEFNARGWDFTAGGGTIGLGYRIDETLEFGGVFSYQRTDLDLGADSSSDIDSVLGSLYGAGAHPSGFYFDAITGFGYHSYNVSRGVLGDNANGDTDGWELNALLNVGKDFRFGNFIVGPVAELAYYYVEIDSFDETDSAFALKVDPDDVNSLTTTVSLKAAYTIDAGKVRITPRIQGGWRHEYLDEQVDVGARFRAAPVASFNVSGPSTGHDSFHGKAGVFFQFSERLAATVDYEAQVNDQSDWHFFSVGLNARF